MNEQRDGLDSITGAEKIEAQVAQNRELSNSIPTIHGCVTAVHGVWHDDPVGPLTVNGRQGYYEYIEKFINTANLLTDGGRDFFHAQDYTNTSAGTRGSNFIAVSTETTAPVAGDTSLAGEITTNGLERAVATTITHIAGTNVTTLAITFTATGAHTLVHKAALFNQAGPPVAGIMTHAAVFTSDVTLATNDTLTVTWTNTLG